LFSAFKGNTFVDFSNVTARRHKKIKRWWGVYRTERTENNK